MLHTLEVADAMDLAFTGVFHHPIVEAITPLEA